MIHRDLKPSNVLLAPGSRSSTLQISDGGRFTAGRVVLVVFPAAAGNEPPFRVSFANVEIWRAPAN